MDMWLTIDTEPKRQIVDEVMRHATLPPEVTGYDVEFGENQFGDPMITVWLHLPHDLRLSDEQQHDFNRATLSLHGAVRDAVPDMLAHISSRSLPRRPA